MKRLLFCLCLFGFCACNPSVQDWVILAPASQENTSIQPDGVTIIPNGRIIQPYGRTYRIAPHPFGLALSPDGTTAVTANSGTSPLSITILRQLQADNPAIQQVPEGVQTKRGILASVFMGLAISPDNQRVYVAGGQENCIYVFEVATGARLDSISCQGTQAVAPSDSKHGYIGDLTLNRAGTLLYAVDQINFQLLAIDTKTKTLRYRVPVGRYPYGVSLSPDEKEVYVANVGMYAYQWLKNYDPKKPAETALQYPPFAYQSPESINGTKDAQGLGDPNAPESFSIWTINSSNQQVTAKVKTGVLVGEKLEGIPAVGGASPNSIVATNRYIFVSNGNNDNISVISTEKDTVVANIKLQLDPRLRKWRGVIPFGLALSPDQKRLYVAESGINAVGVIDVEKLAVIGHIPVGWFPSKLKVTPDGKKLIVANAKGYGSGPNGGKNFQAGPEGSYIGRMMKGSVTIMDIPSDEKLKTLTEKTLTNNFRLVRTNDPALAARRSSPIPILPGLGKSPIKYLVFIAKENRTYDEVFGQLPNGNGDASIARFGENALVKSRDGKHQLEKIAVMPNHLALARQFAISDNYYVDSDVSADGHRWLACTYPNEWVETSVAASYGGNQSMRNNSKAPGNLAFTSSSGAIFPEDYNEAGSLWDHLDRNGKPFWNFGFGTMFSPHLSDNLDYPKGYAYAVNYPVSEPLFRQTSRDFPTYNTAIPDQYRIDKFIQEFNKRWINGKEKLPQMLTVMLGNDHGAGERPDAGFPFVESYMADNDLAVGRLVEFLSRTPYWKNMTIVVTEDDAQGGVDHIDGHRSVLMVISPYAKRNHIGHTHTSFGSIFKTFWNILGIPYLNQYDAGANDLGDLFTRQPDFRPYTAVKPDLKLFDAEKALTPVHARFDWKALLEGPDLDDEEYLLEESSRLQIKRQ
jgi:YVTN family beta-propeller protein